MVFAGFLLFSPNFGGKKKKKEKCLLDFNLALVI